MPDPPKLTRVSLRLETLATALQQKLEAEAAILDILLSALGRGQPQETLWAELHKAAARDERLAELAFAYERLSHDKKLKSLNPPAQAAFLLHAGTFFQDVFNDLDGAAPYFERALALAPGDLQAFHRLEGFFTTKNEPAKLGELYAAAVPHRSDRAEQLELLRRAGNLLGADPERAIKLNQEILRLEPTDIDARRFLEERYERAGRFADLAKLLEQTLAADPGPSDDDARAIRLRLLALYTWLREVERSLPHVEEILRREPAQENARSIAVELLNHKALAARAASILATAHERLGQFTEAAKMLSIEIEQLRGPKRVEAQKRLANLCFERLGDLQKTFSLDETVIPLDPADQDVRDRFIKIGSAMERLPDVIRVLARAASGARDPAVRARIGKDLGDVLLAMGDARKARVAYQGVIDASADDLATIGAGRALAAICAEARDTRAESAVLARLSEVLPDDVERAEIILRLARLSEVELHDPAAAIAAYRRLVGTSREPLALEALERLFQVAADYESLAPVLERRAIVDPDAERARELAFRAADIRSTRLNDSKAALSAWRAYAAQYGASRVVLARLIPLLEHHKAWEELAEALVEDANLAPEPERALIFGRLGQVRLGKLGDPRGALDAYRRALQIDPADRPSRMAVDKMLAAGELRLGAADVLEPLVRAERVFPALVRVLETRAALADDVAVRLSAIAEAAELCSRELSDVRRAIELAGRGIEIVIDAAIDEVPSWIMLVERLSALPDHVSLGAEALQKALGARGTEHPMLGHLARRAGEALVRSGDVAGAISVFRRALASEPSSPELLARVDALLREQGDPTSRIALYRAALSGAEEPSRRRELLHAIGAIARRDLGDRAAAVDAYRQAREEDPGDRAAFTALVELYEAGEEWEPLYEELRHAFARESSERGESGEERLGLARRLAELAAARGWQGRAAAHYRALLELDPAAGDDVLSAAENVARAGEDVDLYRAVFERRVAMASEPSDEAVWLSRLGQLESALPNRREAAAAAFRRAADAAAHAGDRDEVQRLLERLLVESTDDRMAAEQLLMLYRDTGTWERVPPVVGVLLRTAQSAEEAAQVLLAFEGPAIRAGAIDRFVEEADALLIARSAELPASQRAAIRSARAAVIAADPSRQHDVAQAYRAILDAGEGDLAAAVQAFEAFLARRGAEAVADRRWLFAFRVERAEAASLPGLLLAWADVEERSLGDPAAAADLYERVLAIEPEHEEALGARARLLLSLGDVDGALSLLLSRRDRLEGSAREALDLEIATLLLDRLDRPGEALAVVVPELENAAPGGDALSLTRRALARVVEKGDVEALRQATERVERATDTARDPEVRVALFEALLGTPPSIAELREARRGWFERLFEAPGIPPGEALDFALRAIRELSDDLSLWDRAERLAREAKGEDRIAEAYRAALALASTEGPNGLPADAIEELGRRAVDYYEEWFDDGEAVVALLRRTVEIVPTSVWAFERLKLTYNLGERWEDLFRLYDEAIARESDLLARRDLLEDAALLAKDLAGDPSLSMRYFEEILAIRDEPRIRTALERLYERHGRHEPLIALLGQKLAGLTGEALLSQRARIAALWLDGVGDAASAATVVEQMIEAEPDRAEAFELLEQVMAKAAEEPRSPEATAARRRAASLLSERYRKQGRTEELVRVLEIDLEGKTDPKERARELRAIVELRLSALGDEAGAFEGIAALVLLEPEVPEHGAELSRLAEKLDRQARLAEVLAEAAGLAPSPRRIELLAQAAAVYRDRLGDAERAIELLRAILEVAPESSPRALTAAQELDRLLAAQGRSVERCDVLEILAAIEPEPSARRSARAELARIAWTNAKDPDRAIRAFRAAIAEEPYDLVALHGLVRALEELGRWGDLTEVLEQRAAVREGEEAKRDRLRVARILDERLGDLPRAIDVYTEVRAAFGADVESADALAALLEKTERWEPLITLLQEEASFAGETERGADLWRRVGDLQRERTGRWGDAATAYERTLARRPGDAGARQGLSALVTLLSAALREAQRAVWDRYVDGPPETRLADALREAPGVLEARAALLTVVSLLLQIYAVEGSFESTIDLLEPRLAAADLDATKVAILTETAGLLAQHRGDDAAAFDALWRAFLLAPSAELAEGAIRLAGVTDRWMVIASMLSTGLAARPDLPAAVTRHLLWNVARWHRDRDSDFAAAEAALEQAIELDPTNVEMLSALADVQRRTPSRALCATLLRLAELTPGAGLDAYREAVTVAEGPVGDRAFAKSIADQLLSAAVAAWPPPPEPNALLRLMEPASTRGSGASPTAAHRKAAQAASWAIEALVRLAEAEGAESEEQDSAQRATEAVIALLLRGARLPFEAAERRRLRVRAAEIASPAQKIAIYEELFGEDPNDTQAAEQLDALYRATQRRPDLIRLRERQIAIARQLSSRVVLRFDLAGFLAEEGEMARAIAVLRENLSVTPSHPPSIARLAELLEAGGHHEELVALCEDQAGEAETAGSRESSAVLWTKAAALAESRLGDVIRAISDHRRAAALGASDSADALSRLLIGRGEHAAAAEVLEKLCERAPPETLHVFALRLTEAYLAAGNAPAARAKLERALPLARESDVLRERLSTLYREAGEWGPLAEIIAESAARTADPKARSARLREAADLYRLRQNDPVRAVPLLEQAAALAPEDTVLRRDLAATLHAAGRGTEATEVLVALLASYGSRRPKDRALVHYELARVLAASERERAAAELELALRIDPAHPQILETLARISREEGKLERAARTYRALLLVVRKPRDDIASVGIRRTEVLYELSEISRLQGDSARAAEYLESAFEAARESAEEGERLVAVLRARKSYDVLAQVLEARLKGAEGSLAAPLLSELATLYDVHLGRAADALDAQLRAYSLAPPAAETLGRTLDLAARIGQIPRFAAAVTRLLEQEAGGARAIELYLVLGRAHDREGGERARAAEAYRAAEARLLAEEDTARLKEVWRALDQIYTSLGDVEALDALLDKQIKSVEAPAEAASALYRLAALRLSRRQSAAAGVELLERAMAAERQPERAEAALREALQKSPGSAPILRALLRLAREERRERTIADALIMLWDSQERASDPGGEEGGRPSVSLSPTRFDGLKEAMEIAHRLGDQELGEQILRRALERVPAEGDWSIAWALTALAERRVAAGNFAEAATLKERAARASEPAEERALLLEAAVLAVSKLDDLSNAARIYEELRAREPAEREIWQPLAEVYRKMGDRVRLGALLDETAPLLDSVAERTRLRIERARMAMVDDEPMAIELLKEIVAENAAETDAAALLVSLLEKHGRKGELAELLARQIDAARDHEDVAAIVALSMRLGAILEQDWDEQGALDVYYRALDWAPKSREVLRAIVRIGGTREDSIDLGDVLGKLLEVEEGDAAVELALRLSRIRASSGDNAGAEQALEVGYAAAPTNTALREELVRRYAAGESWRKLADLHIRDAEARSSKEEKIGCLCQAADILREHGDVGAAAELLLMALSVDPAERDVLLALIDAYAAMGEHARAVAAIGKVLEATPDDPWLYRSRAALHEAQGRDDLSLADLETAYAKSAGGYASELIQALDRVVRSATAAGTPEARANERARRLRLAEVLARSGSVDRARIELTELTRESPRDREALRALATIEDDSSSWDAAIATYRRLLPLEDGDALIETALRLADACEKGERLGDARSALERALAQRGGVAEKRTAVRERLRMLYNVTGDSRELAGMVLEDAAAASGAEAKIPLLLRAGRLLLDAGGEAPRAVEVLEEARALRPTGAEEHEVTLLLSEAYSSAGRVAEARSLLETTALAHKGRRSKQLSSILRQRARIELVAGDRAAGLTALTRSFECDPQNGSLAMELGLLAVELDDWDVQTRAFRAVTMMKISPPAGASGGVEGTSSAARALAYYYLGRIAVVQGDRRKARMMIEKAVSDDPALEAARVLLEQLRAGT
jgi:golgin subfamily B member 1